MNPSELLESVRGAMAANDGAARALRLTIEHFRAESGTLHLVGDDGHLHLAAASEGIPEAVLAVVRVVPIGKGMAGLAAERCEAVQTCNLQTDATGDVRPGARATGLRGAIAVPVLRGQRAVGALGIGNQTERTFTDAEIALLLDVGRAIAGARG